MVEIVILHGNDALCNEIAAALDSLHIEVSIVYSHDQKETAIRDDCDELEEIKHVVIYAV